MQDTHLRGFTSMTPWWINMFLSKEEWTGTQTQRQTSRSKFLEVKFLSLLSLSQRKGDQPDCGRDLVSTPHGDLGRPQSKGCLLGHKHLSSTEISGPFPLLFGLRVEVKSSSGLSSRSVLSGCGLNEQAELLVRICSRVFCVQLQFLYLQNKGVVYMTFKALPAQNIFTCV